MDDNHQTVKAPSPTHELDIEHLKQVAQSVYERNAELVKLDKMKDEFVALASHELRTPLTIIKNYLWLAMNQKDEPLGEKVKKNVGIALESADRLMFMIEDMLTISRMENGRISLSLEDLDIIDFIQGLIEEYSVKAQEKNITLIFDPPFASQTITADKNRFRQVLVNILGNALKFTPENGAITFVVKKDDTANNLTISVTDTGPGIPKEKQDRLFTKFGKIDESYVSLPNINGTGLGLYISQQIMTMHKGAISIQSDYGHGATFIVTMPLNTV